MNTSRAVFIGHIIKAKDPKPDVKNAPSLAFSVRDERTGAYYPCCAFGNTAKSISERVKVDEPIQWICDILSQPDTLRPEYTQARITFRVISWERV